MVDYLDCGKASIKLIEVTMDTTKLGEAGEMLGIGAGEPLEDITTITIAPEEYGSLSALVEMGIVKEIIVVKGNKVV